MYYIEKENKILFVDEDRDKLIVTLSFQPNLSEDDIKKVPEGYTIKDFQLMTIEEAENKEQQAERNRLDMLYLTGADVERAIYQVKGLDFDDILTMVKDNPTIDAKALKIEFKANNFYRGNPYISQVGALLGFTSGMLDKFFDTKDCKYLTTCKLTINPTPINAIVTGDGAYPYGSEVEYKVEATGYITKTGTVTLTDDTTLEVVLDEDTTTDTPRQDSLEGEDN